VWTTGAAEWHLQRLGLDIVTIFTKAITPGLREEPFRGALLGETAGVALRWVIR
jgi:hypothetical protein